MADKIALEVAEIEFKRFIDEWDIDVNIDIMSAESKEGFDQQKGRIINGIKNGIIKIDEAGMLLFTPQHTEGVVEELTFKVPTGAAYMAMDSHKDRQNMHKMASFMGSMTKKAPATFSKMDARDLKICHAVTALFLGS